MATITGRDKEYWMNWVGRTITSAAKAILKAHEEEMALIRERARHEILLGDSNLASQVDFSLMVQDKLAGLSLQREAIDDQINNLKERANMELGNPRYSDYNYVRLVESKIARLVDERIKDVDTPWVSQAETLKASYQSYADKLMFATSTAELQNVVKSLAKELGDTSFEEMQE